MKKQENTKKPKRNNNGLTLLVIETQKPRYRKYNWRKHLKPKTAPQNILHADAIEAEINIVRQTLTDLEYGGLGITSNDVNYYLNTLSKKLQNYLK
jgi:hypothetical protein